MKDFLRGQGTFRLLNRKDPLGFAFFVPDIVRHLSVLHCEVLLADANHLLNCSGQVLWHAMVADEGGLDRSVFMRCFLKKSEQATAGQLMA